jgi:hypothetical protein
LSECKICRDHGYPGIMIAWDNNVKSKSGRYVPLELDKATPHKHFDKPNKPIPEPNDYPNPMTSNPNSGNGPTTSNKPYQHINIPSTEAAAKSKEPTKSADIALETLTLEFRTLLKHVKEYLQYNQVDDKQLKDSPSNGVYKGPREGSEYSR